VALNGLNDKIGTVVQGGYLIHLPMKRRVTVLTL
jgi:hypothetical protein